MAPLVLKKVASRSNKNKNIPKTPRPFIDRLSVIIDVPQVHQADIHNALWVALEETGGPFRPGPKGKGFSRGFRIGLPSVVDLKKHPVLQIAISKKLAHRIRLELVPVDLGLKGLEELHACLNQIMPNGWGFVVECGRITRIDIAVDYPSIKMTDFLFLPTHGATTTMWRSNGVLQSYYHGKKFGNQVAIYDRKAKRVDKKQPWKGKECVRVETRRRNLGKLFVSDLPSLPNPFLAMKLVEPMGEPPLFEKKAYVWEMFRHTVAAKGLVAALAGLPEDKKASYRKHFAGTTLSWWKPSEVWAEWPTMLEELKVVSLGTT